MFENLLEKSYFYYDGSKTEAVRMKDSEKTQIQEELTRLYECSELTDHDFNLLEKIFIILFNYDLSGIVDLMMFRSQKPILLFNEIKLEFSENS